MTFEEYLQKNSDSIKNMKFDSIDDLKKAADKNKITYSEEELKQAWIYLQSQDSDNCELNDDALDAVAGGTDKTYVNITHHNESHFNLNVKAGGDAKVDLKR